MANIIGAITAMVLGVAALITLAAILAAPIGAVVMLLLGIAHSFNEIIPPLGFVETWVLVFALRVAAVSPNNGKSE